MTTPPAVLTILRNCLERNPPRMERDIGRVRSELERAAAKEKTVPSLSEFSSRPDRQRIPWWMHIIGLAYIVTLVFILYLSFWGTSQPGGFVSSFSGGAMVVQSVEPDSQFAKEGLRPGDRVLMIDNQSMRAARDWIEATGKLRAWKPQIWTLLRDGKRVTLTIVPTGIKLKTRLLQEGYGKYLSLLLSGFLLGLLIAWKRHSDAVGRIGAWFLITASMAFGLPAGWASAWREMPMPVQLLLWIPQVSRFVLEAIFLSFFMLFPRRLFPRRWVWPAIWVPVLATLPWRVKSFYGVIYPDQVSPVPTWILTAGFVRTVIYLLIGVAVLAVSYCSFLDRNEKRRVRVLIAGTAIGLLAAAGQVWVDSFTGRTSEYKTLLRFLFPLIIACPISFGYAILRHRVLDISVIIRQGLQYALARSTVIGLVPALAGFLVLDLALNSDERLADILRSRGWIYAAGAGLSLLAYRRQKDWLEAIDRRFFRERYNAQKILREIVGDIRIAPDFQTAATRVVEQVAAALHPEFATVMVLHPDEDEFRTIVTSPSNHLLPAIPGNSKLLALLQVVGKPLEILKGDSGWLDRRLPGESEFVRRSRIDLLVPIAADFGRIEAILALGIKRSEEPYSREDQELLDTIAASLALLPDQTARTAESKAPELQECPACGICYDSNVTSCRADGVKLAAMSIPRTLTGRYRLERRLGKGGMGTVYEAQDNTLDRHVAIKLIRNDWVDSLEAVQRFRREARAAASFAHPNVVSIYDYGVESEKRAFLVMELLQGDTLRQELKRRKQLPAPRLLQIFRDVCAAVEAAHQRQLIHRDLKPENIFVVKGTGETREVTKVLDFGLAKFLPTQNQSGKAATAVTQAGVMVGTLAYMSPEQFTGRDLDVHWDLWALAVIAYEALTGALPFPDVGSVESLQAVMSGSFTPLSQHFSDPPERWHSFFARCFAPDLARRARSAADLRMQLEQAMG